MRLQFTHVHKCRQTVCYVINEQLLVFVIVSGRHNVKKHSVQVPSLSPATNKAFTGANTLVEKEMKSFRMQKRSTATKTRLKIK